MFSMKDRIVMQLTSSKKFNSYFQSEYCTSKYSKTYNKVNLKKIQEIAL